MNGSRAATAADSNGNIAARRDPGTVRRVGHRETGYSASAVDAAIERFDDALARWAEDPAVETMGAAEVRQVTFERERGGYDPHDVDDLLDAYEDRFAEAEKVAYCRREGDQAWHEHSAALADLVMGRLTRERGNRFRRPAHRRVEGYFVGDVDDLCDRLEEYFRTESHVEPSVIRRSSFRTATRKHAYDEVQVDAFLDTAIQLIQALR